MISGSDLHQNFVFDNDRTKNTTRLENRLLIFSGIHPNKMNVEQVVNRDLCLTENAIVEQVIHDENQQFEVVEQPVDQLPLQENIDESLKRSTRVKKSVLFSAFVVYYKKLTIILEKKMTSICFHK